MFKYFLVVLFFTCQLTVLAQDFSKDEWHRGRVILTDNDTLSGRIKYDLPNNVVQLQPEGAKESYAFSAYKVISAEFIDKLTRSYRKFVVLDFDLKNNNYEVPVFFELIKEGPFALLARERIESYTENYGPYRSYTGQRLVYDYYFLNEKGKIIPFDGKKRSLATIFGPYTKEIKQFIKEERLKLDRMADLARIVEYYNLLANNKK